ncbi:MAG: YggT family protein [Bacillota bacterium]|jgi:YggT family protein
MHLVSTILYGIDIAFEVYIFILFARVIASWIRLSPYSKVYQFLFSMTEPLLGPIRRLMPKTSMLDFSPMILMIVLVVIQRLIHALAYMIF